MVSQTFHYLVRITSSSLHRDPAVDLCSGSGEGTCHARGRRSASSSSRCWPWSRSEPAAPHTINNTKPSHHHPQRAGQASSKTNTLPARPMSTSFNAQMPSDIDWLAVHHLTQPSLSRYGCWTAAGLCRSSTCHTPPPSNITHSCVPATGPGYACHLPSVSILSGPLALFAAYTWRAVAGFGSGFNKQRSACVDADDGAEAERGSQTSPYCDKHDWTRACGRCMTMLLLNVLTVGGRNKSPSDHASASTMLRCLDGSSPRESSPSI